MPIWRGLTVYSTQKSCKTPARPRTCAHAVHTDHLNTPRKLTRKDSHVTWQWPSSAFGDAPPTLGADRHVNPLTTPNAGTNTMARVEFNLRYPGQHFDKESNLSYNYFRSYRSQDGRYTQADPIGLEGGWNRFGYVGGMR
jgi:RHS repeat-associated protein